MDTIDIRTAAAIIAARLRTIAPAEEQQPQGEDTPASAAIADMDALAADPDAFGDHDSAMNAIEMAVDATAEYTEDGWVDDEANAAHEAVKVDVE
jgi:hypothetical protein